MSLEWNLLQCDQCVYTRRKIDDKLLRGEAKWRQGYMTMKMVKREVPEHATSASLDLQLPDSRNVIKHTLFVKSSTL